MSEHPTEKNLELDRLVFFSDAIVAIAITLLALDLKVQKAGVHITFTDIGHAWEKFLAFFLSFLVIAVFWKIHHRFFFYINRIDDRILLYNLGWLLFIVMLPFSTTLISEDFTDRTAIFIYSNNIFLITCFQNALWDYVSDKPGYHKATLTPEINREFRIACNLAMINALVAMAVSFISPLFAFITLFTRTIIFRRSAIQYINSKTKRKNKK